MKIDGGCHCGSITYEAEIDPERVAICHCLDCQVLTGTAFRVTIPVPEAALSLHGSPSLYVKTAASGRQRVQAFCGTCGSHIYATSAGDGPKVYGLRIGTARQRAQLLPRRQIWHHSALPWVETPKCIAVTLEGEP